MRIEIQDYIRAIYEIQSINEGEFVSINDLAKRLNNTNQTINEMIKKMEKNQLVSYVPYKGVVLTKKGEKEAMRLIRIHRLWEVFLVEKLGFSWEEVDEEAHLLEHATRKTLERKLYDFLDKPSHCPHGQPIPNFEGRITKSQVISLSEGTIGEEYILFSVVDNRELLTYLNQKDIVLRSKLIINEIDTVSDIYVLTINGQEKTIGGKIANSMFIKKEQNEIK